jgi:hypothetical protein
VSLPRETMLELMALADGELEGEAKARAEARVAGNAEARRTVDAFRASHLATALDDAMKSRADAAGADGIADAVMQRVGAGALPPPGSRATRLHGPRARTRRAGAVIVGALALAAAVAIYLRVSRGGPGGGGALREARVGAASVDWSGPRAPDIPAPTAAGDAGGSRAAPAPSSDASTPGR